MKEWINNLQPRERLIVFVAGTLFIIFMLYAFGWQPLTKHNQNLASNINKQQNDLEAMLKAATEIKRLRSSGTRAGKLKSSQSLLGVINQSAKAGKLGDSLKKVEGDQKKSVRVWFEQVAFDDLILWLGNLEKNNSIQIVSIVIDNQNVPGRVNAKVVLQVSS